MWQNAIRRHGDVLTIWTCMWQRPTPNVHVRTTPYIVILCTGTSTGYTDLICTNLYENARKRSTKACYQNNRDEDYDLVGDDAIPRAEIRTKPITSAELQKKTPL